MTSVSFGGWNFPLHRVVDDRVGTRDGLTLVVLICYRIEYASI